MRPGDRVRIARDHGALNGQAGTVKRITNRVVTLTLDDNSREYSLDRAAVDEIIDDA